MRIKITLLIYLLFFLICSNLIAAAKRGKDIVVNRIDGTEASGELIAVKSNSLVLLEKETSRDLVIQVLDINTVKVIRRAKPLKGAIIGLASAALIGATLGVLFPGENEGHAYYVTWYAALASPVGIVLGTLSSGLAAIDSTYIFKGRPQFYKDTLLSELRKHARIKDAN